MDLTKAILTLDVASERDFNSANISNLNEEQQVDNYIQKLKDEAIDLFENQKIKDKSELDEKLQQYQQITITELKQKMKDFEKNVDIDKLAENLFELVRERVCQ